MNSCRLIVFVFLAIVFMQAVVSNAVKHNEDKTCGGDDTLEWHSCGTSCPDTCENHHEEVRTCDTKCNIGCYCKKGFVLKDNNSTTCVERWECDEHDKTCRGDPTKEYQECGTYCPANCDNFDKPRPCQRTCHPGCFCKKGFVLEEKDSWKCVKEEECHRVDKTCGGDPTMEFQECDTSCPDTCDNYWDKNRPCTLECNTGCFCKKGLVWNKKTKKCVTEEECHAVDKTCGGDPTKEWNPCGTLCPDTCDNHWRPHRFCPRACNPDCFCKKGFVLENEDSNKCVKKEDCHPVDKTCGGDPHKEWKECGTSCEDTCGNIWKPHRPCAAICVQGCFCKKGFIFDDENSKNCVKKESCPVPLKKH